MWKRTERKVIRGEVVRMGRRHWIVMEGMERRAVGTCDIIKRRRDVSGGWVDADNKER